jgi:lipopolysaccharide export system protein LptA
LATFRQAPRRLPWLLLLVLLNFLAGVPARAALPLPPKCPEFKELCVQAEKSGGFDLKTGVATLEGNVAGVVKSRQLQFYGQTLTLFRDDQDNWARLVLEQQVRLVQPEFTATAQHGVVEKGRIQLNGEARLAQENLTIEGDEIVVQSEPEHMVVTGLANKLLRIVHQGAMIPPPPLSAGPEGLDAPPATAVGERAQPLPPTTLIRADKALIEKDGRNVQLTGSVHVEQSDQRLILTGEQASFSFNEHNALDAFRAEGHVVITQPGRIVSADEAQSQNGMETILLTGNASVRQPGQFDLTSNRVEVYTDATRGTVRSEEPEQPITLTLDVGGDKPYKLAEAGLDQLRAGGVPPATVQKLAPLVGVTYAQREAFRSAVRAVLTEQEAERYLDTILAHAR